MTDIESQSAKSARESNVMTLVNGDDITLSGGKQLNIVTLWNHYLLGYSNISDYEAASKALSDKLRDDPNASHFLTSRGAVLCMQGYYQEAAQTLEQALMLSDSSPEKAWILGIKGRIFRMENRVKAASEVLRHSLRQDIDSSQIANLFWIYAELGEALRNLARYEDARDILDTGRKKAEEARDILETNLNQAQDNVPIMIALALGILLGKIAEYEESAKLLEEATRADPPPAMAMIWGYKGRARERQGTQRAHEALEALNGSEALEAHNKALKAYNEALEAYKTAVEKDGTVLQYHIGVANALYFLGNLEDANNKYREVIDMAEKREISSRQLSQIGWCYYRVGDSKKAVEKLLKAIFLNADSVRVRFNLALARMHSGQHDLALSDYENGIKRTNHQSALRRKALLFVALHDLEEAKKKDGTHINERDEALKLLRGAFEKSKKAAEIPSNILDRIANSVEKPVAEITEADLSKVKELDLACLGLTDSHLQHLGRLKNLEKLILRRNDDITDAGIKAIAQLTSLKDLSLKETRITDAGVAHLAKLAKLQLLNLGNTEITNAGMQNLAELKSLQKLTLRETSIDDIGIKHLANLTNLRILDLRDTKITKEGLLMLANLKLLEELLVARSWVNEEDSRAFQAMIQNGVDVKL